MGSTKKGPCSIFEYQLPKATVIAMYPEGSRTRTWLEGLQDSQWTVVGFNPLNRNVCINVIGTEAEITHTVNLTLPSSV